MAPGALVQNMPGLTAASIRSNNVRQRAQATAAVATKIRSHNRSDAIGAEEGWISASCEDQQSLR
jgi:hypothetical protein